MSNTAGRANANGMKRLRIIMITAPFVMPLLTLLCCSLVIRGIPEALYAVVVLTTVLLATRVLKTYKEYRIGGKDAVGGFDFAVDFAAVVTKAVERGMPLDDAISGAFGFGIGLMIAHFGWSPHMIGVNARASAEHINHLKEKGFT